MAQPNAQNSQLADSSDNPLIADQGAAVTAAAAATVAAASDTAVPLDITYSANAPTPSDTQTIADGTVPTVAELGQFTANVEDFQAQVNVDIADHVVQIAALATDVALIRTALNACIERLEAHGLIADN